MNIKKGNFKTEKKKCIPPVKSQQTNVKQLRCIITTFKGQGFRAKSKLAPIKYTILTKKLNIPHTHEHTTWLKTPEKYTSRAM